MDISDIALSAVSNVKQVSDTEWVATLKLRDRDGYEIPVSIIITERAITFACSFKLHPQRDRPFIRHYLRSCGVTYTHDYVALRKYRESTFDIAKSDFWGFASAIHIAWNI